MIVVESHCCWKSIKNSGYLDNLFLKNFHLNLPVAFFSTFLRCLSRRIRENVHIRGNSHKANMPSSWTLFKFKIAVLGEVRKFVSSARRGDFPFAVQCDTFCRIRWFTNQCKFYIRKSKQHKINGSWFLFARVFYAAPPFASESKLLFMSLSLLSSL